MGQWRLYLPGRRGNENYYGFSQGDGGGGHKETEAADTLGDG